MSVPYGAPPQAPQQPNPPAKSTGGLDLNSILVLVAAGTGLVGYLIGFFGPAASSIINGLPGFCLIATATLAGMRFLPKAPNMLLAAVPLVVYAALAVLQGVIGGAGALAVVLLLVAVVQLAAVAAVLLAEAGVVTLPATGAASSRPASAPQPGQPVHKPVPAPPQPPWAQPGQAPSGQQHYAHPHPHSGPQPHSGAQPGNWVPASGGALHGQGQAAAGPAPRGQQSGPPSGGQQAQQNAGPQGTQQMPHPGTPPSGS